MFKLNLLKSRFLISTILIFSWSSCILAHDEAKIAVVDLDYVVANSPDGMALQAKLADFQKTIQADAEKKQNQAQDLRKRLAEGANSLSESQLNELQKQFEDVQVELRRFVDDKQREGQKMQSDGLRKIEMNLEPVFEKIKNDNNYDLILNRVPGVVVMASDKVDISKKVIEILKSMQ